jgi:hypothetical protein
MCFARGNEVFGENQKTHYKRVRGIRVSGIN